jgi:hypothetical protein
MMRKKELRIEDETKVSNFFRFEGEKFQFSRREET